MKNLLKKPNIMSVILTSFLSLPLPLTSSSKTTEDSSDSIFSAKIEISLPVELLETIIEYAKPETFPNFALVSKDASLIVQPQLSAAKNFFLGIYGGSSELNSWYSNARSHGFSSNKEAFKAAFPVLIFHQTPKNPSWEKDIVLPAYHITRFYLKEACWFPKDIETDYPNIFLETSSDVLLKWNYFKLFQLDQESRRPSLGHHFLQGMYRDMKALKKFWGELKNKSQTDSTIGESMVINLFERDQDTLHDPITQNLQILLKYILLQKEGNLENFTKNLSSLTTLRLVQDIPVKFSTYGDDIDLLFDKTEDLIIRRAQERWKIVSLLKDYLKIG